MSLTAKPLQLYSAQVCPFAQRTRLVLRTKGLDFEVNEIDLDDPPADFREISPSGKVPLLAHEENLIWESTIINEYLEERFPEPALMPATPGERARARIWIDYANNQFVPLYYKLLLAQTGEEQDKLSERLTQALLYMETQGLTPAQPYWMGTQPGLVDFAFYPFFERFGVLTHYRAFTIPPSCHQHRLWLKKMAGLAAVSEFANPIEFYIERYLRYANGTVGNDTAREMREK